MLYGVRRRVAKYPEPFDLTLDWIKERVERGTCERSGIPFVLEHDGAQHMHRFTPSIDRIDSTKGYTRLNCQIVCVMYNVGKGDNTDAAFIDFCRAVASFNADMTDNTG